MNAWNLNFGSGWRTSAESEVCATVDNVALPVIGGHIPILPLNVLAQICLESGIKDLKNMRLVNKTFADLAATELFYEVYCALLPQSMHKIQMITEHPTLKKSVRSIIYSGDKLNKQLEVREEWNKHSTVESPKDSAHDHDFLKFCKISKAQEKLINDAAEVEFLTTTLSRLQLIERFVYTTESMADKHDRPAKELPIWPSLARDLVLRSQELFVDSNDDSMESSFSIYAVLKALGNLFTDYGRSIKVIRLLYLPHEFFGPYFDCGLYALTLSRLYSDLGTIFLNTTSLTLDIRVHDMGRMEDGPSAPIYQLAGCLELAPHLVNFSLRLRWTSEEEDDNRTTCYVRDLLPLLDWKSLRTLELQDLELSVEEFIDFMKRHAPTLLEVRFQALRLVRDEYEDEIEDETEDETEDEIENEIEDEIDNLPLDQTLSSWEHVAIELAPFSHLEKITAIGLTDEWIEEKRENGYLYGIPPTWLMDGHCQGLFQYLLQRGKIELPKYDWPRAHDFPLPGLETVLYSTEYWRDLANYNENMDWKGMQSLLVKWNQDLAYGGSHLSNSSERSTRGWTGTMMKAKARTNTHSIESCRKSRELRRRCKGLWGLSSACGQM